MEPSVLRILVTWAKLNYPWLWNRSTKKFVEHKGAALLARAELQVTSLLEKGWGEDTIIRCITEARHRNLDPVNIFQIVRELGHIDIEIDDLLLTQVEHTHKELYENGKLKPYYYISDLNSYGSSIFGLSEYNERALKHLIDEYDLDIVLYAIDAAKAQMVEFKSPYGLKAFLLEAKTTRNHILQQRKAIEAGAQRLRYYAQKTT